MLTHIHIDNESQMFLQRFLGTDVRLQTRKYEYFVHTSHKKKVLPQYIAMSLKQTNDHNISMYTVSCFSICFVLKTAVSMVANLSEI